MDTFDEVFFSARRMMMMMYDDNNAIASLSVSPSVRLSVALVDHSSSRFGNIKMPLSRGKFSVCTHVPRFILLALTFGLKYYRHYGLGWLIVVMSRSETQT